MRLVSVLPAAALSATLAAALAVASPALSADYPLLRGSQIDTAPPSPVQGSGIDWSGFYLGGHGGGTSSQFRTDTTFLDTVDALFASGSLSNPFNGGAILAPQRKDNGIGFGAIAGYNMMIGDVVVGAEVDYTRLNQAGNASTLNVRLTGNDAISLTANQSASLQDYASARLRFGWAIGSLMPFGTFGAVAGRFNTNVSAILDNATQVPAGSGNYVSYLGFPRTTGKPEKDKWAFGFTVGGGVDYALTDNFLVRAEYLYSRFNDVNGLTVGLNTARVAGAVKF